jgi:hypothetical protein
MIYKKKPKKGKRNKKNKSKIRVRRNEANTRSRLNSNNKIKLDWPIDQQQVSELGTPLRRRKG